MKEMKGVERKEGDIMVGRKGANGKGEKNEGKGDGSARIKSGVLEEILDMPLAVTHPSTNRAQRGATKLIGADSLQLMQAGTWAEAKLQC